MSTIPTIPPSAVTVGTETAERLEFPDGSSMTLLADGLATGGKLSVHHTTLLDGADGASPHHHTFVTELLYVLSGSVQILAGEELILGHEGHLAVVPPGTAHAFAAAPGSDAELLVVQTPGIERFDHFRRLAQLAAGLRPPGEPAEDQCAYDNYSDNSSTWQRARTVDQTLLTNPNKDTP